MILGAFLVNFLSVSGTLDPQPIRQGNGKRCWTRLSTSFRASSRQLASTKHARSMQQASNLLARSKQQVDYKHASGRPEARYKQA